MKWKIYKKIPNKNENEQYKLIEADIIAISFLTGKQYLRSTIVKSLEDHNGNYQDTLRELLGGN